MGAHAIARNKLDVEAAGFGPAAEAFWALVGSLHRPEARAMTEADAERHIREELREVGRRLLQSHVDGRAPAAAEGIVVGADDVERTHQREHSRRVMTSLGRVDARRIGYGQRGVVSLHPLDAELNLPSTDEYSHVVREQIAELAAKQSFESAIESRFGT